MTLVRLALSAIAVQLADLGTWASLPAGAERNPVAAAAGPLEAAGLKVALLVLVVATAAVCARRRPAIAETVLLIAVIAGALGTGSNIAVVAGVEASTSRPAPQSDTLPAQAADPAPGRTATPSEADVAPWTEPVLVSPEAARDDEVFPRHLGAPALTAPAPSVSARRRGVASWYCCTRGYDRADLVAAAGPALRVGRWRGRVVTACAGDRCVRVRLVDWCGCPGRRVIDLQPAAFARLAPLSRGLVDVVVRW